MSAKGPFLRPRCTPATVDTYVVRSAILAALREHLPDLGGTVLDVGCGRMPYRELLVTPPGRAERYIGLDFPGGIYDAKPDIQWDRGRIPLPDASVDSAVATEVLEHCPEPEAVLREVHRVLRPRGIVFLTVPFMWPLHDVPHDEYRYTPFSLERHLRKAGFADVRLRAMGGWDASLAQMLGLWARRRPMGRGSRRFFTAMAAPAVRWLQARDEPPRDFGRNGMITGIAGTARRP